MTQLTPEQQAALADLRDIHLPDPVSWWPLAPGWWALVALALLAAVGMLAWTALRRRSRRHLALSELDDLKRRLDSAPEAEIAADLARLVRRVALAVHGRGLARLADSNWAEELAEGRAGMPADVAGMISEAPYRRPETMTRERLRALVKPTEAWIRRTA